MGVHGLSTFLQENKRPLSKTFQNASGLHDLVKTPVIVDGWSFIYKVYQDSNLSWVYGGEYPEFANLVTRTIQAWIDVGFEVYFVFDGPCPEIKFPTVTLRLNQSQIQHSLLFFRTSISSRTTARFLNETRILPPLSCSTCLQTLLSMAQNSDNLHIHFADEEGDPFAVELAGRVGGYVIGNDSDFVVLNSEGYKGYIPLDQMVWIPLQPVDPSPEDVESGEFHTVRKSKTKRRGTGSARIGKGIIPPDNDVEELILSVTTYSPDLLAAHLKIPVTLLPLLGALVGNDFTSRSENPRRNIQSLFFERHLTLSRRIERAASTIHNILNPDPSKKREKHHVGSVMDLINRTVNTLLARWTTTISSGEIDNIVENIVSATLQYALPKYQGNLMGKDSLWPTEICALHDAESCTLLPMISHLFEGDADIREADEDTQKRIELRGMFLAAYRKGLLSEKTMDILSTASYWPRLFLENPDVEAVSTSIGRPIRMWIYAILADAVGLPAGAEVNVAEDPAAPGPQVIDPDASQDENKVVDVVESNSEDEGPEVDLLAPLKGDLEKLHSPQQDVQYLEEQGISPEPIRKQGTHRVLRVVEHVRRGTRIVEDTIDVVPLVDLLLPIGIPYLSPDDGKPLLLRSQADALTVLLRAVHSDTPRIRGLHDFHLTAAISLRWLLYTLQKRAEETPSRERDQERWTQREALCFLAAFTPLLESANPDILVNSHEPPPVTDRNVQLTAQILMSLDTIKDLAGVLLISSMVPPISREFSGKRFHALLTNVVALDENAVPAILWSACRDGLEDRFLDDNKRPERKMKKAVAASPMPRVAAKPAGRFFALLSEGAA